MKGLKLTLKSGLVCVRLQVIILIGNKADLEAQRDVTYEEAKQFAEENGEFTRQTAIMRCSSRALLNADDLLILLGLLFLEASAKT